MSPRTATEKLAEARRLVAYIDSKARGLDDFGDFAAIPSQPWTELCALLAIDDVTDPVSSPTAKRAEREAEQP